MSSPCQFWPFCSGGLIMDGVGLRWGELQVSQCCLTADRCSTQGTEDPFTLPVWMRGPSSGDSALPATVRQLVHLDKWKGWDDDDDEHEWSGFYWSSQGACTAVRSVLPPPTAGMQRQADDQMTFWKWNCSPPLPVSLTLSLTHTHTHTFPCRPLGSTQTVAGIL